MLVPSITEHLPKQDMLSESHRSIWRRERWDETAWAFALSEYLVISDQVMMTAQYRQLHRVFQKGALPLSAILHSHHKGLTANPEKIELRSLSLALPLVPSSTTLLTSWSDTPAVPLLLCCPQAWNWSITTSRGFSKVWDFSQSFKMPSNLSFPWAWNTGVRPAQS